MDIRHFHHALKISENDCTGCSHCMQICPTEAIRLRNGKAVLYENRCVDCGECFRVCPVKAISIEQDDFERIREYKHRIALLPLVFLGQFPYRISREQVYQAILDCGFTQVIEVELSTGLLQPLIIDYARQHPEKKPHISSFCPAIIRLIQVKFPSLVENIIRLKPPLDITALYCRRKLTDEGIHPSEIGVFYVTPCAAKIAAIKSPVGEDYSVITGVINSNFLFNKVKKKLVAGMQESEYKTLANLPPWALQWTLTHGEARHIEGRNLAIDGIHNVIEFLEKLENDEIANIDFLELRACDESCAGGVLNNTNRFLITERLRQQAGEGTDKAYYSGIMEYEDYLKRRSTIGEIRPRSMMNLDSNMETAMKKMVQANELMHLLPGADCGICGAPNCQALAKDIVQGEASVRHCIFIQKSRERSGELTQRDSLDLMKEIWGNEKFI